MSCGFVCSIVGGGTCVCCAGLFLVLMLSTCLFGLVVVNIALVTSVDLSRKNVTEFLLEEDSHNKYIDEKTTK